MAPMTTRGLAWSNQLPEAPGTVNEFKTAMKWSAEAERTEAPLLAFAASAGNVAVVEELVRQGVDPNARTPRKLIPSACHRGLAAHAAAALLT